MVVLVVGWVALGRSIQTEQHVQNWGESKTNPGALVQGHYRLRHLPRTLRHLFENLRSCKQTGWAEAWPPGLLDTLMDPPVSL